MNPASRILSLTLPRRLEFGCGCAAHVVDDLRARQCRRVFVVADAAVVGPIGDLHSALKKGDITDFVYDKISCEPTVEMLRQAVSAARDFRADAVIGLGGGSVMDVAKLVAALLKSDQDLTDVFGIGKLAGRSTYLACLPTTAGTGSEVSPNAILLDESDRLKKGVISPHLMPDAALVDPLLTLSAPASVTAATGMDALTHCIEAYANRFAHPLIDLFAMEGIRLISRSLAAAVGNGADIDARTNLALGSMYGGICLGPVNTGAVHALAYPLGGEFHIAHGISNAVMLPHVLEFNLPSAPARYAEIAVAMGEDRGGDDLETARLGLGRIRSLCAQCGIPGRISQLGIPEDAIPRMARSAMTVTRLLERNVREVKLEDAMNIYRSAL
jgi:alcohol dehydrogenase class IV